MPVRHSFKRILIHCMLIVSLLALAFCAVVWSMRSVWHTHTFHYGTPIEASLVVQYPDGWKFQEIKEWEMAGQLTPAKPSGLIGWWAKYILRQDSTAWKNDNITVALSPTSITKAYNFNVHKLDRLYQREQLLTALGRTYKSVTSTSIDSNGIKGFDIEAHQPLRPASNKSCMRYVLMYIQKTKTQLPVFYEMNIDMAEENYRSLKPTINEIIRRLRLVEDNRVSP